MLWQKKIVVSGVININICRCCYCKSILEVKTNLPITQPKERLITTKLFSLWFVNNDNFKLFISYEYTSPDS